MTTAHMSLSDAAYDETDVLVSHNSPCMTPIHPKLELSPSPPLEVPATTKVSRSSERPAMHETNCKKARATPGDAVLVSYLGDGRNQDVVEAASQEIDDEEDEDDYDDGENDGYSTANDSIACGSHTKEEHQNGEPPRSHPSGSVASPELRILATESLRAAGEPASSEAIPRLTAEISASYKQLSIRDDLPHMPMHTYRNSELSPHGGSHYEADRRSSIITSPKAMGDGALPPLQMDSPKSDFSTRSLPSIKSIEAQLGDFQRLSTERPFYLDEIGSPRSHGGPYPVSPTSCMPRLPPISGSHTSPPVSPHDAFTRHMGSPGAVPTTSSQYQFLANGALTNRSNADYSSSATGETPGTDQSGSTPATSTSVVTDPMSLDNISNPMGPGYQCTEPGCHAPPFQTQYLLSSHANVHSSARPHYCPVPGCPRGEAGKGFKRKNEMIRHGLVHDSPGYVCPFCPEREHKYPRPDNLQR